eukprot:SAG31_NODE_5887_length_2273_cov_1.681693_1_plen_258_part_00
MQPADTFLRLWSRWWRESTRDILHAPLHNLGEFDAQELSWTQRHKMLQALVRELRGTQTFARPDDNAAQQGSTVNTNYDRFVNELHNGGSAFAALIRLLTGSRTEHSGDHVSEKHSDRILARLKQLIDAHIASLVGNSKAAPPMITKRSRKNPIGQEVHPAQNPQRTGRWRTKQPTADHCTNAMQLREIRAGGSNPTTASSALCLPRIHKNSPQLRPIPPQRRIVSARYTAPHVPPDTLSFPRQRATLSGRFHYSAR